MAGYSNGYAISKGVVPCETNPTTGKLSRTTEPFHARAEVTVGARVDQRRRVCVFCRGKHHATLMSIPSVM